MKSITDLYPALSGIADYGQWLDGLRSIELAANSPVYTEGQPCQGFPLLLSGCIRVFKQAENGREIELYRIDAGESCIVSISSLISNRQYQARAVTERASVLYLLPAARFHAAVV